MGRHVFSCLSLLSTTVLNDNYEYCVCGYLIVYFIVNRSCV